MALFIDATWQAGSGHLAKWAQRTKTGNPREIINPGRSLAIEAILRKIAPESLGLVPLAGISLGVLVLLGIAAYALSQWKT